MQGGEKKSYVQQRNTTAWISERNTDQGKDQIIAFYRHHKEFYI